MHSDAATYPDFARTDRAWPILTLILVGAFSFDLGQGSARADGSSTLQEQQAPAVRVWAIFREKCTQCHDPKLRRPIGKFTDVLDLARLAEDPHLVVPFQAEASNLWKLVQKDKMPPAGAKAGPLTSEEKAVVHAWIASGAPVDSSTATGHTALSAPASPKISVAKHILGWLGKFHILIVHFPIALLLAAAFGETLRLCWSNRGLEAAVRFCVVLAALSSVPAAALGWLHADIGGHGAGSMEILRLHRWLGTAACLWAWPSPYCWSGTHSGSGGVSSSASRWASAPCWSRPQGTLAARWCTAPASSTGKTNASVDPLAGTGADDFLKEGF